MEIKFRGKNKNGEWFYGTYHYSNDRKYHYILNMEKFIDTESKYCYLHKAEIHEVVVDTVGQFIGLKDKNGKEIYEGDVLKIQYFKRTLGENLGVMEVEEELIGVVSFDGLTVQLANVIGEKWSKYTGYTEGEGSVAMMYLHDVYDGSTDAEWQIEIINCYI